jgi:hypothetical protein
MFKRFIRKIGLYLISKAKEPFPKNRQAALQKWFAERGDQTLRLDYALNNNSIVFDLGGYKGEWASAIYCKYSCRIFIFEPSKEFFKKIQNRFLLNSDVSVYNFGLAEKMKQLDCFLKMTEVQCISRERQRVKKYY